MSDSQRKPAGLIHLDNLPHDHVMVIGTPTADYEVWRNEDGTWSIAGGMFDEDTLVTRKKPYIDGLGKPAILGHVTTGPVIYVGFELMGGFDEDDNDDFTPEPPDDDLPPTGGATVPLIFAIIDLPIRPRFPREWAFLSDGGRLGVVA